VPEAFHFLHPLWLWALLPLPLLLWGLLRRGADVAAWRRVIQPHLLPHLVNEAGRRSPLPAVLLAAGWTLAVLALANPAWERQPTPLLKSRDARVIVLDLSRSMTTPDLLPSRLARARFKVADILERNRDGQSALVVFAGDAFVVSPLTEDGVTIAALLGALDPGLMPVQGGRADLGLNKAGELLIQAGMTQGEVLLIADEADDRAESAAKALRERGYRVSVLAVGTEAGAPLPNGHGGFITGTDGKPVVAALVEGPLRAVAQAGGGRYALISAGDQDLQQLLPPVTRSLRTSTEDSGIEGERWNERGPLLVLLLLPLAALAFRRGWLLALAALTLGGLGAPDPALAIGWDDLWSRSDQQAAAALEAGEPARAAALARDPMQQGAALYRSGEVAQALERFSEGESADAHYNRGNALAKLGQYENAIAAYDEALAREPAMEDATFNKTQVEELLRRRKEPPQQQEKPQGQSSPSSSSDQQSEQAQDQQGQSEQHQPDQPGKAGSQDNPPQSAGSRGTGAEEPQSTQNPSGDPGGSPQDRSQPQAREPAQSAQSASNGDEDPQHPNGSAADPQGTSQTTAQDRGAEHSAAQQQVKTEPRPAEDTAGEPTDGNSPPGETGKGQSLAEAEPLDTEQRQAIDQWLRRIPDDPGGLLRRKFLYQYRERSPQANAGSEKPW